MNFQILESYSKPGALRVRLFKTIKKPNLYPHLARFFKGLCKDFRTVEELYSS